MTAIIGKFHSACIRASHLAKDCSRPALAFSYELGKEVVTHSLAFLPAFIASLTPWKSLSLVPNTLNTASVLGKHCYQMMTGSAKAISSQTARIVSYCASQALLSYACLMVPYMGPFASMETAEQFLFTITLLNSLGTACLLGKQAYQYLKESHLLQKISPFQQDSSQITDWKKVAKVISRSIIGTLSLYSAYRQLDTAFFRNHIYSEGFDQKNLYERRAQLLSENAQQVRDFSPLKTISNQAKNPYLSDPSSDYFSQEKCTPFDKEAMAKLYNLVPGSFQEIQKHLPSEDSQKISDFFTITNKNCQKRYSLLSLSNPIKERLREECYSFDTKMLEKLLSHPTLLAELYKLGQLGRFKNIQEFLNYGLPTYLRLPFNELFTHTQDILPNYTSFERAIRAFRCYTPKQMSEMTIPPCNFENSRCYDPQELEFFSKIPNGYSLPKKGKIPTPSVYFKADYDHNGALQAPFEYVGGSGSAAASFIQNRNKIYFGILRTPQDLCSLLLAAFLKFEAKIKHLWWSMHGRNDRVRFSNRPDGDFALDTTLPPGCLTDYVEPDATLFIDSCRTASSSWFQYTISQAFADWFAPGTKVMASNALVDSNRVSLIEDNRDSFSISIIENGVDSTVVIYKSPLIASLQSSVVTFAAQIFTKIQSLLTSP